MGKSVTPKYRVEFADQKHPDYGGPHMAYAWKVKEDGKPTNANVKKWLREMNETFKPGGVNEHLSKAFGYVVRYHKARVVNQTSNEVMAEFAVPLFEVE